jgi:hypothetical protein
MRYSPGLGMARALGWFSIALGAAELLSPRRLARATGIDNHGLLQAYGVREIATGIGILQSPRPAGWMWGRVAGDLLDVATLGAAMANGSHHRRRSLAALAAVAGATALDVMCAAQLSAGEALTG